MRVAQGEGHINLWMLKRVLSRHGARAWSGPDDVCGAEQPAVPSVGPVGPSLWYFES